MEAIRACSGETQIHNTHGIVHAGLHQICRQEWVEFACLLFTFLPYTLRLVSWNIFCLKDGDVSFKQVKAVATGTGNLCRFPELQNEIGLKRKAIQIF